MTFPVFVHSHAHLSSSSNKFLSCWIMTFINTVLMISHADPSSMADIGCPTYSERGWERLLAERLHREWYFFYNILFSDSVDWSSFFLARFFLQGDFPLITYYLVPCILICLLSLENISSKLWDLISWCGYCWFMNHHNRWFLANNFLVPFNH
jgi:hypothetical protein